jgi:hypothetical protein
MKYISELNMEEFVPWQPSTWPNVSDTYNSEFSEILNKIVRKTILDEIGNVISDAHVTNGSLEHRGHVVVLAMLCAVDSISSYAFDGGVGENYRKFISTFFPPNYQPFAKDIYDLYRNSSVHSWNLFKVGIRPGDEQISNDGGSLEFGLINFFDALKQSVDNFLKAIPTDSHLQTNCIKRYTELKNSAIA